MAEQTASEILDTLMKNLKEMISTKTVVGDPIEVGKTTILPVMKASLGFGAGGGLTGADKPGSSASGGGGGGGVSISPVGFLVIEEGKAMMVTPRSRSSKWEWVAESIPELWEKLSKWRKEQKDKRAAEDTEEEEK